ncbi:hypothetical protein ABVT39_025530 [Epinephelus coioides]
MGRATSFKILEGPHWVHLSLKNYFLAPDEVCLTATFLHLFYKVQSKDVAMLLKVKYQNTKKYIRLLSGFTFLDFIAQVKYKFGLPDATELDAFDETNTVVEEDIFSELIEASPDLCLTVRDRIPDAAQTLEQDIVLEIQINPGPSPTTQDGISEEALRDQLLLGLRKGSLAQALNVYARCNPDKTFAAIRQEALLLDAEHGGSQPKKFQNQQVWRDAFAACQRIEATMEEDGLLGYVWPAQRRAIRVPPRSEVLVWGRARMGLRGADYCALVEALPETSNVGVARTLAVVKDGRVPVRICNPHPYCLTQGQYQKLGKLYHVDEADVHGPRDLNLYLENDCVVEVALVDAEANVEKKELPKETIANRHYSTEYNVLR